MADVKDEHHHQHGIHLQDPGTIVEPDRALGDIDRSTDAQLARVGKKAVLRQNFGFWSMLALSATTMGTWEGIVILFGIAFTNGGYLGSFIGIWIVFLGTACSVATMAEMVSMAPTAGGQYHWVAILSPRRAQKFLSYIAAWLTVVNWQASVASAAYASAQTIQGMVNLNMPDYTPTQWQIPLIYWALLLVGLLFNTILARVLPQVENTFLFIHIAGFIGTMVTLLALAPKTDPSLVFGPDGWINSGNWPTQGTSFMVGIIGSAFAFSGADSAAHMVEEIDNAAVNVPRAMVYGVLLNGLMGVGMLTTLLFCLGDPTTIFSTDFAFPAYQIYFNATNSIPGTEVLAFIVLFVAASGIVTYTATASRATWAFARDRGLPGWKFLMKVDPRLNLPMWAICATMVTAFVLSMIAFGSNLAFQDVVSLTISASFATYMMGNTLLLWRRTTGQIRPYSPSSELTNTMHTTSLSWGPWRIPEPFGTIVNIVGIMYLLIIFIFSFFPVAVMPDAPSMNWSVFMFGVIMIFAAIWYFVYAHRRYDGPVVEIDTVGSGSDVIVVPLEKKDHDLVPSQY